MSKLKLEICLKVLHSLHKSVNPNISPVHLARKVVTGNTTDGNAFSFHLPVKELQKSLPENHSGDITDVQSVLKNENAVNAVSLSENGKDLVFHVDRSMVIKEALSETSELHRTNLLADDVEKIIVEFGSPNIAKPFHVGHLRSIIIGNFIANLYKYLGHSVIRMNYPGDWGTQFGLVKVGLDIAGYSEEELEKNPIRLLYEAYVLANKKASEDPQIAAKAREAFKELEEQDVEHVGNWGKYRQYTIKEFERTYARLGIIYDEYEWESSYGKQQVAGVMNLLESKGLLKILEDGRNVVELSETNQPVVVKSDGTLLYLSRDLAAAESRKKRHNFDRMIYVVDNGQAKHFITLFEILSRLEFPWADKLSHVKFGRIRGMSTRKGNVVFLEDVLDEIRDRMRMKQHQTATTKADIYNTDDKTSDILGISSVIVNDLKQKRLRDYDFDWDRVLHMSGDTGSRLQYAHCRLWSLEQNCGVQMLSECDPSVLTEPEVTDVVEHIVRFDEVLRLSSQDLEARTVVKYLFSLSNSINRAFKVLRVKNQDPHIAAQRLMLFNASRKVLNHGMTILGLQPLNQM